MFSETWAWISGQSELIRTRVSVPHRLGLWRRRRGLGPKSEIQCGTDTLVCALKPRNRFLAQRLRKHPRRRVVRNIEPEEPQREGQRLADALLIERWQRQCAI